VRCLYIEEIERELNQEFRVETDIRLSQAYVIGAGDSFASSITIEGETGGRFRAIDPYDGFSFDLKGKPTIFVSVSGKPFYNIRLARKLKGSSETYAITANPSSELAESVDHVIKIPYKSEKPLPGTLSFLMTTYVLFKIAGIEPNVEERQDTYTLGNNPFFVGSNGNYGISVFAYLKMSEIFGIQSNAERTEQFCHSPVFSTKGRQIVILGNSEREKRLAKFIDFTDVKFTGIRDPISNAIIFLKSLLSKMKRDNWDKIFFLDCRKILNVSSSMIYYDSGS